MHVYAEVLKRIQSDYVTEPNIGNVTTGALHGLLESLDADSSYLTPTEYKIYKDRPATGVAQVGVTVSKRFGYATIVSVTPGSPADKEHLADGDVIESIGDQSTRELSLAVIRLMLEGKPGITVTLSVVRPRKPDPDKLTLTRTIADPPALNEQQYDNSTILYLKPGVLTAARVDEIAAKLKAAGKDRKDAPRPARLLRGRSRARACVWPTSSSTRAPWPRWKARSSPPRPLPPIRRSSSPALPWPCWSIAAPTARLSWRPTRSRAPSAATWSANAPSAKARCKRPSSCPTAPLCCSPWPSTRAPTARRFRTKPSLPRCRLGQASDDDFEDECAPRKKTQPLNKALELLKAKNG